MRPSFRGRFFPFSNYFDSGRGHDVTLFEKDPCIGGQFNMAKVWYGADVYHASLSRHILFVGSVQIVPGKEEFYETIRYFKKQLELTGLWYLRKCDDTVKGCI